MTGYRLCGCIPGHRSNHVTHACLDCGLRDCDVEDGNIPPCTGLLHPATSSNEWPRGRLAPPTTESVS